MRILILGAKGNLGQELVKVFAKDHEIIAWGKGEVDITDKDLIVKKIKDVKPVIIINAAAYNAVDKCETDEKEFELAKKINGKAVGYLAEAALETGAILIHYSTDYVFSGRKKTGYNEDDLPKPINKYGESKLLGERAVISLSGKGLRWYLIRTSKLFGPKGGSEFSKESFFDLMLRLSKEREVINAISKEEISSFTYTPDLAKATCALIDEGKGFGIYHITNNGAVSWYEAVKYLFQLKNIKNVKLNPISSSGLHRPAKRPKHSVLLNNKLKPMRSWKEALREYLNN